MSSANAEESIHVYYLRHGETDANVKHRGKTIEQIVGYIASNQIVNTSNPLFDALLTQKGQNQARAANARFSEWFQKSLDDVILVSSPNRRALHTLTLAVQSHLNDEVTYIHPHLREFEPKELFTTSMWCFECWPKAYVKGFENDNNVYTDLIQNIASKNINKERFGNRIPEILVNGDDRTGKAHYIQSDKKFGEFFDDLFELCSELNKRTVIIGAHSMVMQYGIAKYFSQSKFQSRTMRNAEIVEFEIRK